MEIKGSGLFLYVEYEGKQYYRLSYRPLYNYQWFECDFETKSMQALTNKCAVKYDLAKKLEDIRKELVAPKQPELNTEEMFKLLLDAVKRRDEFDSSNYQPNAKFYFTVTVDSEKTFAVLKHMTDEPYVAAIFSDREIQIYIPNKEQLGGKRGKKINRLLRLITEKFNIATYLLKEEQSSDTEFVFFKREGEIGPFEKVVTPNPLIIPLSVDT
jgi:predicted nucleic acid-binding Zn ribbon protein